MRKKIDLKTYKRKGLFEAFRDREIPFLSTTCNVDVTKLRELTTENGHGFFVSISFLISKTVNLVPEFRHRIIDGELFEYERIDPAYTVLLDDETFSFCDSRHYEDFQEYREHAEARMREVRERPDQSVGDKNHMFFITSIPWFSFTSFVHPYCRLYASIPVVTIGGYFEQGGRLLAPVGVQAHHGLVDGIHLGKFYSRLADMCRNPAVWLRPGDNAFS